MAQACRDVGVKLVHISTDNLFDDHQAFAQEDWPPAPLNIYGKTKTEAEAKIGEICKDALIVRTNFYGWGPGYRHSFSDTVIWALQRGQSLTLFDNVFYTSMLIEPMIDAVEIPVREGASGIYNVAGDGRVSKFEFGVALADKFGLDGNLIRKCSIGDRPALVRQPRDMSLSNAKLRSALGRGLGGIHEHQERLPNMEHSAMNPSRLS